MASRGLYQDSDTHGPLIGQFPQAKLVSHLAVIHGEEAVNAAGIAVLGYPGMWATEKSEARSIESQMAE